MTANKTMNRKPKNGDVYKRGSGVVILTNHGEVIHLNTACEHSIREIGEIKGNDEYIFNTQDLADIALNYRNKCEFCNEPPLTQSEKDWIEENADKQL